MIEFLGRQVGCQYGGTEECRKTWNPGKTGHSRNSGVYGNAEFSSHPGKTGHSKNWECTFVVSSDTRINIRRDIRSIISATFVVI